jgi:hypothetical protein
VRAPKPIAHAKVAESILQDSTQPPHFRRHPQPSMNALIGARMWTMLFGSVAEGELAFGYLG